MASIGGVILCSSLPSLDHLQPLIARGLQLVTFDRIAQAEDPASLVSISIDNAIGAQLAAAHLIELGHRRLAFVSGALGSVNRKDRYRGFISALELAGLTTDSGVLWRAASPERFGDVEAAELGRSAARELLSADVPPTGIVAINDMCAIGICRGIRDAGATIARDVSVVGFDDIVLAELVDPPLTTIRQPIVEMAAATFNELRQRVEQPGSRPGRSLLVRPELVVRESTAAPPD